MDNIVQLEVHKGHLSGFKLLLLLLWLVAWFCFGMHLFTQGFFLRRSVVANRSTIHNSFAGESTKLDNSFRMDYSSKPIEPTFEKAVLVIVDALRFDFLTMNKTLSTSEELPYQNRFKNVHDILERNPGHGGIYRFIADPPTTTMQRIKGLTTGSLPTFLDMASNFGSDAVEEDNIIDQLVTNNKNVLFVGDDTWIDLYPKAFTQAIPCPSFNVKDLDTVDLQVMHHIPRMIKNGSFDFLIGHSLGVDHCGHTFGPMHQRMTEKLIQMDNFISETMNIIDNNTLLIVIGDHGMTTVGDHGGDSDDEVNAGLLFYANRKWLHQNETGSSVDQIDLVPTISLLLGIPIPFSNLGSVIMDVFDSEERLSLPASCTNRCKEFKRRANLLRALHMNTIQVSSFLKEYEVSTSEILLHDGQSLLSSGNNLTKSMLGLKFEDIENDIDFVQALNKLDKVIMADTTFLRRVKVACKQMWANFELGKIVQGIIFCVALVILWIFVLAFCVKQSDILKNFYLNIVDISSLILLVICSFLFAVNVYGSAVLQYALPIVFIMTFISGRLRTFWGFPLTECLRNLSIYSTLQCVKRFPNVVLLGVYCVFVFSNSYVVYEDQVLTFFLQSMILIQIFRYISIQFKDKTVVKGQGEESRSIISWSKQLGRICIIMLALLCNWLTVNLRNCREEQNACRPSHFAEKLSILMEKAPEFTHSRVTAAILLLIGSYTCLYYYLKTNGSCAAIHPLSLTLRIFLPSILTCLIFHWVLQSFPNQKLYSLFRMQYIHQIILPRTIYLLVICAFCCFVFHPLGLCVINKKSRRHENDFDTITDVGDNNVKVQAIFKHLKSEICKQHMEDKTTDTLYEGSNEKCLPMVYGLGTVYSSAFLVYSALISVLLIMCLGDGSSVGFVLYMAVGICVVHFTEVDSYQSIVERAVFWSFLCSHGFYATGHQPVISAVRLDAGFLGIDHSDKTVVLPALLVVISTFAAHIINATTVPLLVVLNTNSFYKIKHKEGDEEQKEEMVIYQHPETTIPLLFQMSSIYVIVRMIKLLAIATAAAVHRRHLMVWKIFAPRFLFEVCSFLISIPFLFLGILFFLRIEASLRNFLQGLEQDPKVSSNSKTD